MTLQSFFCLGFLIVPTKHINFLNLSLYISEWNESKLPMFIKNLHSKKKFLFLFEKMI